MFSETTTAKLKKLIPRLASDSGGEVVATVEAIRRVLKTEGKDLHDLASVVGGEQPKREYRQQQETGSQWNQWQSENTWHAKAVFCQRYIDIFRSREAEFINDMVSKTLIYPKPTEKQAAWLDALYQRAKVADAGNF